MKSQFVDDVIGVVFYGEEVAIVAITRCFQSIFSVPLCIFNTEVFCLTVTL